MAADSKSSVVAALVGNSFLMVLKFIAWAITGSGAMFAEAIHSLADVGNQGLLLVGIVRSGKGETDTYQYGHGQERYVWALISAVGIFFLGCGVTLAHGIDSLLAGHEGEPSDPTWAIVVLSISLVVDAVVLTIAAVALKKASAGKPFFAYLREEADPAAVAVLLEDFAATFGVLLALGAIGMAHFTGQGYWDSIGSILIGLLLGGVALWLTFRNRELLLGRAAPQSAQDAILAALNSEASVERIVRFKSKVIDTETYDVLVELEFHGDKLAGAFREQLEERYAKGFADFEEFFAFQQKFADDVLELLGDKVDLLEKKVKEAVPQVKHIDVEPD